MPLVGFDPQGTCRAYFSSECMETYSTGKIDTGGQKDVHYKLVNAFVIKYFNVYHLILIFFLSLMVSI